MEKPQELQDPTRAFADLMSGFGVALATIGLGSLILPLDGESYEWAQYLLAGTVFPAALLVAFHRFFPAGWGPALGFFRWGAALGATAFCFRLIPMGDMPLVFGFALAGWVSFGGARGLVGHGGKAAAASLFLLAALCGAWGLFSRFGPVGRFVGPNGQQLFAVFLAAGFAFWYRPGDRAVEGFPPTCSMRRVLAEAGLVALLALAAFRAPDSINENHEFFVGSAALVRQGGWLLWDVPSQYGFLSILLLAALPFSSLHFGLYVAASALQLVCAIVMYIMLRGLRQDAFGAVAAAAVALTMGFMVSGGTPNHAGLNTTPSTGAMRFFFCYLLLAWSYWNIVAESAGGGARGTRLLAGSIAAAAGFLWSAESMVFCAGIWLPQSLWLSWETAKRRHGGPGCWRRAAPVFGASLLPAFFGFTAVNGWYLFQLGHLPDWGAFAEYAKAYSGGFGTFPIDPNGGVWGMLLLFAAVAVCAASAFRERLAAWPALVGILALFWSSSSYFISRSAESNILNLAPLHFTCAIAAMSVFKDRPVYRQTLWAALVPLAGVLFILTWGNPNLHRFFSGTFRLDQSAQIGQRMPKAPKPYADLLRDAGYRKGEPLVVIADMLPPALAEAASGGQAGMNEPYRFWLPFAPATEFLLLSPERRAVYLARFGDRFRKGGWMLMRHEIPTEDVNGFFAGIEARYTMTFSRSNEEWLAMRFEPRPRPVTAP